jgi:KaiC/GvpD/RAD55 family RecA-like ATPase
VEKMRGSRHSEDIGIVEITDNGVEVTDTGKFYETLSVPKSRTVPCPFNRPNRSTT